MDAANQTQAPETAPSAPSGDKRVSSIPSRKPKESDYPDDIWHAAHADFRSGLTYGRISEIYGIPVDLIVRRKQREQWNRDLRDEVQVRTFETLAAGTAEAGASRKLSDDELVDRAAKLGAQVVTRHRVVLSDAIASISKLAGSLRIAAEQVAAGVAPSNMAFLGPKETLSEAALKLSNALARVVPLERKAFGLEDGGDQQPMEERLKAWYAAKRANSASQGADAA